MDFRALKGAAKELVAPWDHQDLNLLPDFKDINPSAEQIAKLGPVTHVRLNIFPDGGVSRLRLFGKVVK
ncbi:MAG: 6-carboxytetrahydropterin synthase, partial [Gammaproteobacteria bacterium]